MSVDNPVLVEVSRGKRVESRHRGAVSVVDADGQVRMQIGDVDRPVFPRSAVKAIQALALVESGAASAYDFGDRELALACASHSGEATHIALARHMLDRAGLDEHVLACGGHWASRQPVLLQQARQYNSVPPAICNNCSGKHTGFVCTAAYSGIPVDGYVDADHPIQINVRDALQDLTGTPHDQDICGTDGCSIPTYAVPLPALARGLARLTTGTGLAPQRGSAALRLTNACMKQAHFVAGTGRFCTQVMTAGDGAIFAKTGAEGVFCGALPGLGLGIALKCDDGAVRAAETIMAAVLAALLPADHAAQQLLCGYRRHPITNWNGTRVGEICSTDILSALQYGT